MRLHASHIGARWVDEVTVDGVLLAEPVVQLDDTFGWVDVFVRDRDGLFVIDYIHDAPLIERRYGAVAFTLRPDAPVQRVGDQLIEKRDG